MQKKLLLGRSTAYKHRIYDQPYYCTLPYKRTEVVLCPTDAGGQKTSTMKRLVSKIIEVDPRRPVIVIDMQGVDWKQVDRPSTIGTIAKNLGETRKGLENVTSYTPKHLSKENHIGKDKIFTLSWRDLDKKDWEYYASGGSGKKDWSYAFTKFMLQNKYKITSLDHARKEILACMNKPKKTPWPSKLVPEGITKQELKKWYITLDTMVDEGSFTDKGLDIIKKCRSEGMHVFNFHSDDETTTILYVSIILRNIYHYYLRETARLLDISGRPKVPNTPILLIEEMNFLSPAKPGSGESPGEHWVRIIVTKAQKAGFYIILIMQDLHDISSKTRRPLLGGVILVSAVTNKDKDSIREKLGDYITNIIMTLDNKPDDTGAVEWAMIYKKVIYPFRPLAPEIFFQDRYADAEVVYT